MQIVLASKGEIKRGKKKISLPAIQTRDSLINSYDIAESSSNEIIVKIRSFRTNNVPKGIFADKVKTNGEEGGGKRGAKGKKELGKWGCDELCMPRIEAWLCTQH